ncbi:MAG TPA: ABC transporter ATP-binding protein, partial [Anaerolineales bacterium]|nr:ABC transporter ATP-binding protein [Anaerolineales bacterium]
VADLSGGEQQRVALARALAIRPRLLMFDEPLGALDRSLREDLLNELRTILHQTDVPAIYVTHDQEEAFTIADRVLILHDGKIVREGKPADVWADPQSAFVAEFLGLGNILDGEVVGANQFQTEQGLLTVKCPHKHAKGEEVKLLARPFEVEEQANAVSGVVKDVIFQHDRYKVLLENDLYLYLDNAPKVGEKIDVKVAVECLA